MTITCANIMDNRSLHRAINRVETLERQTRGIWWLGMGISATVVVLFVAQVTCGLSMGSTPYLLLAASGVNMVAFYVWEARVAHKAKQAGAIIKMRVFELEHRYEKLVNARQEIQLLVGDAVGNFELLYEKLLTPPSDFDSSEPSKSTPQGGDASAKKNDLANKKIIQSPSRAPYPISNSPLVNILRMMEYKLYLLEAKYNDAENELQACRMDAAYLLEKVHTATAALIPAVDRHMKQREKQNKNLTIQVENSTFWLGVKDPNPYRDLR